MSKVYLFAGESGTFTFERNQGASKYFILVTVTARDCTCGNALLQLRRELAWEGEGLETEFHATTDQQVIRDRVLAALAPVPFRIDATILEKAKAQPQLRRTEPVFYKYAWFYHMKYVTPKISWPIDDVLVVGAAS